MKHLPVGRQDFASLINDGCLYVDKTADIHRMATQSKYTFLSRPRRFGKSLTCSTLKYLFEGRRELFKGLWIENQWDWDKSFRVLHFDFNTIFQIHGSLEESLSRNVDEYAEAFNMALTAPTSGERLRELLKKIHESTGGQSVILIDEYDKPIINYLGIDTAQALRNRDTLKSFYSVLKPADPYLRFVFITGVSKFSQVSIFSDLNNLDDITLDADCAALCGYTQEELENYFSEHIPALAAAEEQTVPQTVEKIRFWYNGFRFSGQAATTVYNPFSTLLLMRKKEFVPYWFETGSPTFLIKLIREKRFAIESLNDIHLPEAVLRKYDIEELQLEPLLLQTGYLTIKDFDRRSRTYTLSYPNYEVEMAFSNALMGIFDHLEPIRAAAALAELYYAVRGRNSDSFFHELKVFFADIPYELDNRNEKHYQTIFYLVFKCLGFNVQVERRTSAGRIDCVIEEEGFVWIFEFKLQGSAAEALAQIRQKEYFLPYVNSGKAVTLFGVGFDRKTRNIGEWVGENV